MYSEWTTSTQKVLKDFFVDFEQDIVYFCDHQTEGIGICFSLSSEKCFNGISLLGSRKNTWDTKTGAIATSLTKTVKLEHSAFLQFVVAIAIVKTLRELSVRILQLSVCLIFSANRAWMFI